MRKTNTLATRPAFDSKQRDFVAFLASIGLQHYAQKLREEQIDCLADLKILNNEPPSSKTEFVKILAENPRPIWSETIYEFLNDESSNEYRAEALQALNRIGHPKLLEVLKESLQNRDDEIRQIAFAILASRNEPESEQLALEYTLQYIAEAPPTEQMRELIMQTNQAAV